MSTTHVEPPPVGREPPAWLAASSPSASSAAVPAIRTTGLTRRFQTVTAVRDLDLEIAQGTIFGFLGPNGAGKTTTIRLLLGVLDATAGAAQVLGMDVATRGDAVRRACGVLLEHNGLYERLSAEDNLDYFARLWHLPRRERERRIAHLLEQFGLAGRRHEIVGGWSRGMKQKVAIARALLHHPKVVFLDEPTAGLDPIAAVALRNDLASLAAEDGATVFITTHNLDEAERLCDRVGVISGGRLLAQGTPDELRNRGVGPRLTLIGSGFGEPVLDAILRVEGVEAVDCEAPSRVVVRLADGVRSAPIVRAAVLAGAEIDEARSGSRTLEAAFFALLHEDAT